jgi:putative transposase
MPRCPAKDYADRCRAVALAEAGLTRQQIAQTLQRPERWLRRTLVRYDPQVGLDSLKDRPARPQRSPNQTPPAVEEAILDCKRAHSPWGRRQICRQLRWQRPGDRPWLSESRVRRVLARHPELRPRAAKVERRVPRQIDYLVCNLLWATDIYQTRLPDGSLWETLTWLDLHSRYALGQVSAARLTEQRVIDSFLAVARQHGLPYLLKTDGGTLFFDATSGLPSGLTRVLTALGVRHLVMPKKQPWWNGVMERYIRTCRQEVQLPEQGDLTQLDHALETMRHFYNDERCHSRCADQPPASRYQPSPRQLPANFDPQHVPYTDQPTPVSRQVQASGRVSLLGRTFPFRRGYAGQTITVTVDRWSATAQAADGWQRTWDLQPTATQPPVAPPPPAPPQPLTRTVNRRGCILLRGQLYYLGLAWVGQTLTLQPQPTAWQVTFPDGSLKTLPDKALLPQPRPSTISAKPKSGPPQRPELTACQPRRVTRTGQVAFYHHLYYVGIAHQATTVYVARPRPIQRRPRLAHHLSMEGRPPPGRTSVPYIAVEPIYPLPGLLSSLMFPLTRGEPSRDWPRRSANRPGRIGNHAPAAERGPNCGSRPASPRKIVHDADPR